MTFRMNVRILTPVITAFAVAACSVKAPPEDKPATNDDLVEQSTALAELSNSDLLQITFDHATRIDRAIRLATAKLPSTPFEDGCLSYAPLRGSNQMLIAADCTGREERQDTEKIDRTLRGRGVLRLKTDVAIYGLDLDVRRFRPNQPGKTLRTAKLSHSVQISGDLGESGDGSTPPATESTSGGSAIRAEGKLVTEGESRFVGHRALKVAKPEAWTIESQAQWDRPIDRPATMRAGANFSLTFNAENGNSHELVLVSMTPVSFAKGVNNECLRPIGSFKMKSTLRKMEVPRDVKVTVVEKNVATTEEGILIQGSTSVVPWPMGCLENVSP